MTSRLAPGTPGPDFLNRYWQPLTTSPRPESYAEDLATLANAEEAGFEGLQDVLAEIAAGAETGWSVLLQYSSSYTDIHRIQRLHVSVGTFLRVSCAVPQTSNIRSTH